MDVNMALLALLAQLDQIGLRRIREYDLHLLVSRLAPQWWPELRFITKPTVYSPALHRRLHELERHGTIDELILVHDSWSPRHEYTLTTMGRVKAKDALERLRTFSGVAMHQLEEDMRCRILELFSHEKGENSSNPSEYRQ